LTETMVTHTLLKDPGAMFVVPEGTAHDGGSLMDTLTVPIMGLCREELPPPQLMTISVVTTNNSTDRITTARPLSRSSVWAITRNLRGRAIE